MLCSLFGPFHFDLLLWACTFQNFALDILGIKIIALELNTVSLKLR